MSATDTRCQQWLRISGQAYPRTCGVCGLGPCRYYEESAGSGPQPLPHIQEQSRQARLESALGSVLIGGNHLGLLIGTDHPPHTADLDFALTHYFSRRHGDRVGYEAWCCWSAIMRARDVLEG